MQKSHFFIKSNKLTGNDNRRCSIKSTVIILMILLDEPFIVSFPSNDDTIKFGRIRSNRYINLSSICVGYYQLALVLISSMVRSMSE